MRCVAASPILGLLLDSVQTSGETHLEEMEAEAVACMHAPVRGCRRKKFSAPEISSTHNVDGNHARARDWCGARTAGPMAHTDSSVLCRVSPAGTKKLIARAFMAESKLAAGAPPDQNSTDGAVSTGIRTERYFAASTPRQIFSMRWPR